jgi:hypothetical protein
MFEYFMTIWSFFKAIWCIFVAILSFYGRLVYFLCFGILYQGKSGNPAFDRFVSTKSVA